MNWQDLRARKFRAARVLRECAISRPPVWSGDVATELGVHVHDIDEHPGWNGALKVESSRADLWYWSSGNADKDNFFIAFELGRLVSCEYGIYRDENFEFTDGLKRSAYLFAEELLMPRAWIKYYAPHVGFDIGQLADILMVQEGAVNARVLRLKNAGKL